MKYPRIVRHAADGLRALAALVLFASVVFSRWGVPAAFAQRADVLVMIIASSTPVTDIPADVVRSAFLGLRTEHRGVRLIAFNSPLRTPPRERLDRVLLGLEPDEVGLFWVDQRVRDGRNPPRTLPSDELAVRIVAQLSGAIACVPARLLVSGVRALRIDGKGPTDRGYLLAAE
jgi:hypothetical protein